MTDYTYDAQAAIPLVANLNGTPDGSAMAFGHIDNDVIGAIGFAVRLTMPIAAGSTGTYTLYLAESTNGTLWCDGIDPINAGISNVAGLIRDCIRIKTFDAAFVTTDREVVSYTFSVEDFTSMSPHIGLILLNESGQQMPVGNSGVYRGKHLG